MALRGKKPETIEKRLKAFFYGNSGVGKTRTAIQFPRPYLIDTERGAENNQYTQALIDRGGLIFQTSDFSELITEIKSLLSEKHEYKTLIIDPMTTVYNDLLDKSAAKLSRQSAGKDGTEHGRHYGEAAKHMRHLLNLLMRLDMNVIMTSHAKNEYGEGLKVIGSTFDCYRKLDYLFDLVFEVQDRGSDEIIGIVKKTRIESFQKRDQIPFNYDSIAGKYGREILERDAKPEDLATEDQITEIKRLIDLMNIQPEVYEKWLDKGSAENWEEMSKDFMQKCIDALIKKLTNDKEIK